MKIKAVKAYYNDRQQNPVTGNWSIHKNLATGRTISIQGNPASVEVVEGLIKNSKKPQARAGISEAKADLLRYEHLIAMFEAYIGTPPLNVKEDFTELCHIKVWAMCILEYDLILHFNELVAPRMEWTEFHQDKLDTVNLLSPGGTKMQHGEGPFAFSKNGPVCTIQGRDLSVH